MTRNVSFSFIVFVLMSLVYGLFYWKGARMDFFQSSAHFPKAPVVERIPATEAWNTHFSATN